MKKILLALALALGGQFAVAEEPKEKTRVCRRDTSDDEAFRCRRCSKEFNSSKTLLNHLQHFCGKDKSDDDDDDDERVDHEVNNRTSSGSNHLIIKLLLSLLS